MFYCHIDPVYVVCMLTFSVYEPLAWGCVGRGQLLFDLCNVLRMKVVKQTLAYEVILERG